MKLNKPTVGDISDLLSARRELQHGSRISRRTIEEGRFEIGKRSRPVHLVVIAVGSDIHVGAAPRLSGGTSAQAGPGGEFDALKAALLSPALRTEGAQDA